VPSQRLFLTHRQSTHRLILTMSDESRPSTADEKGRPSTDSQVKKKGFFGGKSKSSEKASKDVDGDAAAKKQNASDAPPVGFLQLFR
jgi:hypothetical protein